MKRLIVLVILLAYLNSVSHKSMSQDKTKLSFLALGDSYTIGEAVKQEESWPYLLAKDLNNKGLKVQVKKVIATTGWTTDELLSSIEEQEKDLLASEYGLVSLLIGVNNQYRGYDIAQYKKEFEVLIKKALTFAAMDTSKVFIVSIPDYGVTPFAKDNDKDEKKIASELMIYNQIAQSFANQYNIAFYDITPISLKAIHDEKYVAKDGLHPSANMYKEWVEYFSAGVGRQITK